MSQKVMNEFIFKTRIEDGVFIGRNAVAQDDNLSLGARGLFFKLLSRPATWEVNINELKGKGAGRDKIKAFINELIDVGLIHKEQQRDGNRYGKNVFYVFAHQSMNWFISQSTENQSTENEATENELTEKPSHINKRVVESKEGQKEKSSNNTPDDLKDIEKALLLSMTGGAMYTSTLEKRLSNQEYSDYELSGAFNTLKLKGYALESQQRWKLSPQGKKLKDKLRNIKEIVITPDNQSAPLVWLTAVYAYRHKPNADNEIIIPQKAISRISESAKYYREEGFTPDEFVKAYEWSNRTRQNNIIYRKEDAIYRFARDWRQSADYAAYLRFMNADSLDASIGEKQKSDPSLKESIEELKKAMDNLWGDE